ncbi:unnamed protein product [Adineta steineri]|uniref:G-protein coupled receptors family 1 profile domain-containing protein n=2 Tax=Adineta steineri TaxID=433720 RepID=A0A819XY06_9BILA|nr:unnamed protein product [Adineta steineri]
MDSNNLSNGLLIAPVQLNIYLGLFIYITGVIGSFGNIIIYKSRSLRNRACSIYLFWGSLVDLIYLNSVLLTRILQKGFKIPIMTRYDVICKIRQFASNYGNQLTFTFLALATLDRLFLAHQSPTLRRWGNRVPLANKLVISFSLIWLVILCHRLIWYDTINGQCEGQAGFYAYFDNIFNAVVTCLLPMITLTVLGILIGRSVHRVVQRRRVVPTATINESAHSDQSAIQKIDTQLTIMLFLDIFVSMISFLPYAAQLIYANITGTWPKSPLRVAWENVVSEIINLLSYIFFSGPFYVSIISLSGFRHQLLRALGLKKQQTTTYTQRGVTMGTTQNNTNIQQR